MFTIQRVRSQQVQAQAYTRHGRQAGKDLSLNMSSAIASITKLSEFLI